MFDSRKGLVDLDQVTVRIAQEGSNFATPLRLNWFGEQFDAGRDKVGIRLTAVRNLYDHRGGDSVRSYVRRSQRDIGSVWRRIPLGSQMQHSRPLASFAYVDHSTAGWNPNCR